MRFNFPDLPINARRKEIVDALRHHRVVVVVGETGSGKTTQLPKMALEAAGKRRGRVACTQPRRLAAVAVARRLAEEVGEEGVGQLVGYRVRFDNRTSDQTLIELMTDGILLAETQHDPDLRAYHTIILDEAHERSLNIDFLLGYMKLLLARRNDLRVVISSATLDAAAFSDFFGGAPVIQAQGRGYPVEVEYMPPQDEDEELPAHVVRAVRWITEYDANGDVLVFLPGEREIRECAACLEKENLPRTVTLPLYARLSLAEQQRIFRTGSSERHIVLATNVAETSLTIPGIIYVIDSGLARISRYLPGRQIQSLQTEPISQASARQRAGRCGRLAPGVCIRLYAEDDFTLREAYTDPEIRRSALAGVILRMADLRLPPLGEFPLPDPPSPRLINEGFRTLREIGAMEPRGKKLTPIGHRLAKLPLDPRLGRILLESQREVTEAEALVIVAGLSIMDPRERPTGREALADQAHSKWRDEESDFLGMLRLWREAEGSDSNGRLQGNALRRWCAVNYLNVARIVEWRNLVQDLCDTMKVMLRRRIPTLPPVEQQATPERIHRCILAGAPLQIGQWNVEERAYRSTAGRVFSIFPGSGLFRRKNRAPWVFGAELAETGRLWLRRAAVLDPAWVEQVAPHLCSSHIFDPQWDPQMGVVYAKQRVVCSGLTIVDARRVSYADSHPREARAIMIRDGILCRRMQRRYPFLDHLEDMLEHVAEAEHKLRRRDLIRCDDSMFRYFDEHVPAECTNEKSLREWLLQEQKSNPRVLFIPYEECIYPGEDSVPAHLYPDEFRVDGEEYPIYYRHAPGEEDDGVTIGVHIDQLEKFPDWLSSWGIPAQLPTRIEMLLRSMPKNERRFLLPLSDTVAELLESLPAELPHITLNEYVARFVSNRIGHFFHPDEFNDCRFPEEFITKIWVCDDEGLQLAIGTDGRALRQQLSGFRAQRFRHQASRTFSSSPMTHWDCGDLPASLPIGTEMGFPALADEGNCVRVRILPTAEQAEYVHRAGVRRLAFLRCGDFLRSMQKKPPIVSLTAKFALASVGRGVSENVAMSVLAAMDATLMPLPRGRVEFESACLRMRENLYSVLAGPISQIWEQIGHEAQALASFLPTASSSPALKRIATDLDHQWNWLTRPGFLTDFPPSLRSNYLRYLRGITVRLDRLRHKPIDDDLKRLDSFERLVPPGYYAEFPEHADSVRWLSYGVMVEEYRLALFAPTLSQKGAASEKKLLAANPLPSPK